MAGRKARFSPPEDLLLRAARLPKLVLLNAHSRPMNICQVAQPSFVTKHILDELLPCLLLIAGRTLWQVALSPKWSGARRSNLSHSVCSRSNWSGERRRSFLDFSSKEKILWKGRKRRRSNLGTERTCQRGDFVTCFNNLLFCWKAYNIRYYIWFSRSYEKSVFCNFANDDEDGLTTVRQVWDLWAG